MGREFERTKVAVHARKPDETPRLNRPPQYRVYLVNDDYTPMDFVVLVLETFFGMHYFQAVKVMLDVHQKGSAQCGIYTRDIAQTKVVQVNNFARLNNHPLLCKMEKM